VQEYRCITPFQGTGFIVLSMGMGYSLICPLGSQTQQYDPATPFLDTKELKAVSQRDISTPMLTATLITIAKKVEATQMSTSE
jgi:hypothetical protein